MAPFATTAFIKLFLRFCTHWLKLDFTVSPFSRIVCSLIHFFALAAKPAAAGVKSATTSATAPDAPKPSSAVAVALSAAAVACSVVLAL
jgi:hypothetical protein